MHKSEREISITLENYIKKIGELSLKNREVRVKDIADALNVKLSTVTSALKILSEKGYINYKPYKPITLTEEGEKIAHDLINKKEILTSFFEEILDISEEDAGKLACEMEHTISKENLEKFKNFLVFIDSCPFGGMDLKNKFRKFRNFNIFDKNYQKNCQECINQFLENCPDNTKLNSSTTTLNNIKIGEQAEILKVKKNPLLAKRFCEMGGVAGTIVRVEKIAPLGDPISIRLKGSEISIRKDEAENIIVRKIKKESK